jgi:hypothetical protein
MSGSMLRFISMTSVAMLVAGCAVKKPVPRVLPQPPKAEAPQGMACTPVQANNPLIGAWYSLSTPRGVSGHLQALTTLSVDGTSKYETQLKIGGRVRPALRETGCWTFNDDVYTVQTVRSNGELVDITDPIYRNSFRVEKVDGVKLVFRDTHAGGQTVRARKVGASFRLP